MTTKPRDQEHERTEASPPAQPKAGAPVPSINEPATLAVDHDTPHSINEPPGSSTVSQEKSPQVSVSREAPELPPDAELERMTRAELDSLAEKRDVDISQASNKDDVIAALRRDARKRHR